MRVLPPSRSTSDHEAGAAAVELALVLPLLLLIVIGIIRFGQAYYTQITLTQASREGVRVAALGQANPAGATTSAAAPLTGVTVNVTACPTPSDPSKSAQVTATATVSLSPLPNLMSLVHGTVTSTLTVTGKAQMRCTG
jgi:Flp pilus assembly protein TadG